MAKGAKSGGGIANFALSGRAKSGAMTGAGTSAAMNPKVSPMPTKAKSGTSTGSVGKVPTKMPPTMVKGPSPTFGGGKKLGNH